MKVFRLRLANHVWQRGRGLDRLAGYICTHPFPRPAWLAGSWIYVDALVLRDRDTDGSLDERLYVAQDADSNIMSIFDNADNVVERYAYSPYGVATILTPVWSVRLKSASAWQHLHNEGVSIDVRGQ